MEVSRKSPRTGKVNVMVMNITQEQLDEIALPISKRRHIQVIVPTLNADEREFLISGFTVEDWDSIFDEMTD